ncbi:MAG: sporulation protein YabP [Oscillospiraceae bacterium]|nr:sporulation protein YabP [Oscillospiraceae bacterium]MDD6528221.1 sporulation protein YabP [Oscillospiraceae bacterium]
MTDTAGKSIQSHSLILENRNKLSLSGVTDVDSFDETTIVAYTDYGELTVSGTDLHICVLNIEHGELTVEGNISGLNYLNQQPKSSGFLSRMFR